MLLNLTRRTLPSEGRTVGFIDIGTNSIRLLLVRINADFSYQVLSQRKESVRLGEGEYNDNELQLEAMQRAILVCRRFVEMAHAHNAGDIVAVATSATRDAENQAVFLRRLRREAGLEVRVVSGREEARLIYLGVSSGINLNGNQALFIDIGGGSTEVIVGDQQQHAYLETLQLGHIRLTHRFFNGWEGPVEERDYLAICDYVRNVAIRPLQQIHGLKPTMAVGSSGTIENLADIAAWLCLERERHPDDTFSLTQLQHVRRRLCQLSLEERAHVSGINPDRADVILAGAAILETVMEAVGLQEIHVSERGLRDGLLLDYLSRLGHKHPEAGATFRLASVYRLGRALNFDEEHAAQVAELALQLFDSAAEAGLHKFGEWERELLHYAALLHDVGIALSYSDHHEHSYYFIRNADLLGFDQTEIDLIAATAYFHRKQRPKRKLSIYGRLRKSSRRRVRVLSSFLSMAESLDRTHLGLIQSTWFSTPAPKRAVLHLDTRQHAPLEIWGVVYHKKGFREAFGRKLSIEMVGVDHPSPIAEAASDPS